MRSPVRAHRASHDASVRDAAAAWAPTRAHQQPSKGRRGEEAGRVERLLDSEPEVAHAVRCRAAQREHVRGRLLSLRRRRHVWDETIVMDADAIATPTDQSEPATSPYQGAQDAPAGGSPPASSAAPADAPQKVLLSAATEKLFQKARLSFRRTFFTVRQVAVSKTINIKMTMSLRQSERRIISFIRFNGDQDFLLPSSSLSESELSYCSLSAPAPSARPAHH